MRDLLMAGARAGAVMIMATILTGAQARAAESFIIVDNQTGFILASKDVDDKRQIASLTKVATAMVVLDWARLTSADLGELVPVTEAGMRVGGVNPAGFQTGDLVSLRDLLYSALMASDNVAAHTLAYHIGRRLANPQNLAAEANFVAHMNALARNLNMKRTRFMNPSGLDNLERSAPTSSAADMARLTRYAYSKSSFPFYVSQKTREIQINRTGQPLTVWLRNTNPLLDQDGIDGVKTGRTAKAGDCIVLSSDKQPATVQDGERTGIIPRRIIVVLLATSDRSAEGLAAVRRGWALHDAWSEQGRLVTKKNTLD